MERFLKSIVREFGELFWHIIALGAFFGRRR